MPVSPVPSFIASIVVFSVLAYTGKTRLMVVFGIILISKSIAEINLYPLGIDFFPLMGAIVGVVPALIIYFVYGRRYSYIRVYIYFIIAFSLVLEANKIITWTLPDQMYMIWQNNILGAFK